MQNLRVESIAPTAAPTRLRGCFSEWEHSFNGVVESCLLRAGMQRGGLASNPLAQWRLAVTKPALQHGIRRCDFFTGGCKHHGACKTPFMRVSLFFAV